MKDHKHTQKQLLKHKKSLQRVNEGLEEMVFRRTRELLRSKEKAEAANQAKSNFLASLSHEIRTPMNGVLGILHLLSKTNLNKSQQRYINTIYQKTAPPSLAEKSILIADDNPASREAIAYMISSWGMKVYALANDGNNVLTQLRGITTHSQPGAHNNAWAYSKKPGDILLIDISRPDKHDSALLQALCQEARSAEHVAIDLDEFTALLNQLQEHLDSNLIAAQTTRQLLQQKTTATEYSSSLTELEEALNGFDVDTAKSIIKRMIKK